jgi:hypothetical protein
LSCLQTVWKEVSASRIINESVGIGKAEREVMEAIKIQRDIRVFKYHPIADTEQKVREKDGKE